MNRIDEEGVSQTQDNDVLSQERVEEMTVAQLREALRVRSLSASGLKLDLKRRLMECEELRAEKAKKRRMGLISSDFDQNDATCPCCLDLMRGAIYQCRDGHTICAECFGNIHGKKKHCPTCRTVMDGIRNRALENVLAGARMPCRWHSFGCSRVLAKASREAHEKVCEKLAYGCPDSCECRHVALAADIEHHLWQVHKRKLRAIEPGKPRFARFQNVKLRLNKVRSCLCAHDHHVFALIIVLTDAGGALLRAFLLRRSNRPVAVRVVKVDGFAVPLLSMTIPIEDAADLCVDQLREYLANSDCAQAAAFHVPDKFLPPVCGDNKELRLQITFLPSLLPVPGASSIKGSSSSSSDSSNSSSKSPSSSSSSSSEHSPEASSSSAADDPTSSSSSRGARPPQGQTLLPLSLCERMNIRRLREDDEDDDDDSDDDSDESNNSDGTNADY